MILSKLFLFINLIAVLISFCCAADPNCNAGRFISGGKCELCPPGTYQDKKGASECIPCPPGFFNQYKGAPGHDICKPCKAGTFSTVEAATSRAVCKPCPAGKHSPEGADRCLSCPAGSFISKCAQGQENLPGPSGNCLFCEFGSCERRRRRAELKCRKCSAGTFSPKKNSLECPICPGDTLSKPGSSKCNNCPPGQGNEKYDGVCRPCKYFYFNDGKYGTCQACPDGFQGNKEVGSTKCVPCPAGTGGLSGSCNKCNPGENTVVTGATFCAPDNTPCASNFFRNARGACERCAKSQRYNKSKNECEPCGKHEVSKGGVDKKCTKCPPGETAQDFEMTYDEDARGRRCVCKFGFARRPDGKCEACSPGWHRNDEYDESDESDSSSCLRCGPGSFAPRPGTVTCLSCPKKTAQPLWGQSKCVKCARGLQSTGDDCVDPATGCRKDQKRVNQGLDFFCASVGADDKRRPPCEKRDRFVSKANECVYCPFNSYSKGGRSKSCEKCDGIFWTELSGCQCITGYGEARELVKGKCRVCPPGTFGRNGASGCKFCPAGTFRGSFGGAEQCDYCGPGTFSNPGAAKCTRCPEGTNTFGFGFTSCVKPESLK